jgi:transketolase
MNYNNNLEAIAKKIRKDILTMSFRAKSAHTGGALSCVEILVALYFKIMRVYPKDPYGPKRDRLIFSKAHDAKVLYATLSERGFFDKKKLRTYEANDGLLAGHSVRYAVPGIEASAGSLGHGLPIAAGIALAGKLDKKKYRVYTILSDGECDEGSTWEAALFSGHHKLDNLIAIVDYNKLQGFGYTKDILDLEPFAKKWEAFGWRVREIDGHNFQQIINTLRSVPFQKNKPSVVIAHTIKGLGGIPKHINQISSQYKPPTEEEYASWLKDNQD